jgi:hypothetical protein
LDGNKTPFTGRRNYKIHFLPPGNNQGGIPPVVQGGFWSVTIYDLGGKLIKSPDTVNANWNAVGSMFRRRLRRTRTATGLLRVDVF